jgi:hypothetical protein
MKEDETNSSIIDMKRGLVVFGSIREVNASVLDLPTYCRENKRTVV